MEVTWNKVESDNCPSPREGQCSCVTEDSMYVFGGVAHTESHADELMETNELIKFSFAKNKWEKVVFNGEPPAARTGGSLVAVDNCLYLFGGLSHSTGWFNDLFKFDISTNTWSPVDAEGTFPSPRDKLQGVAVGQWIYYFGGFGPKAGDLDDEDDEEWEEEESDELPTDQSGADFGWFNDLHIFDTVSKKWTHPMQMNLGVPTARAAHVMCAVDKQIVIFGGRDIEARQNDIHIFNTETRKWDTEMKTKGQKPEPRSFHAAVSVGSKLVVIGGRGTENQHFADVHVFDCESKTWTQVKQNGTVPEGRSQQSLGVIGDKVIMYGGTADFCPEINACQRFFTDTYTFNTGDITKTQLQNGNHS
ncbi:kelch domain-containing protein 1-like [Saccostrea echinata]|uniref:kelch domain-containing protein 1-like n=1 Tax=Saccostrea echinata TaxID=191078 RepID=UPI002A82E725|nr:kelch domain-containing protein 1-like [Saccostrea echinata]